ncbi:hypothetical protein CYMTET_39610 [Cymbomonas tetramitiformis]|uniref:Uncharacterized protein n=1 Tax=Cymbomonas tetramitiformis TaxID=36881 RepID=A0AAE0C9T7_9CHLO|nr:hypothetical protein CYMTET_39610 [Cymbomonas tetramitiformis]
MYYSNLADLRELSRVTGEELRQKCIPMSFSDEFGERKSYVSSQMASMWLLVSTCGLSVQVRSRKLIKMYKDRITVCRDESTGMRFRVLSVPPGLGKTAMVMGAITALVRNGMFQEMMRTADAWCKQVRSTSGMGAYFSDSSEGSARARPVIFLVCPDNVWGYWHNTVVSHIRDTSSTTPYLVAEVYPATATERFMWKRALQLVERADSLKIVMVTPAHFAQFLKEGHNLAWPLTVFDEFSAHCNFFGNCATPLCREFWAVTATPNEICGAVSGNLKTNPFRGILGDKFARCETAPHELRFRARTTTQATEMLCGNAQVLLLTTIPRSVIDWITEEVSGLMFDGVALLKRPSFVKMRKQLLESHVPRERIYFNLDDVAMWDLSKEVPAEVSRPQQSIGDHPAATSLRASFFREVDANSLPRWSLESVDRFGQAYANTSTVRFKRSRDGCVTRGRTCICKWWNGSSVETLVDLPTVLRLLEDATRTLRAGIERVVFCESQHLGKGHEDGHEITFMRNVFDTVRMKLELLQGVARRLEAIPIGGYLADHPLERDTRSNFALRCRPFGAPVDPSSVLVCMNCSCCLRMDDVLSSGWYLDNVRWTAKEDVNLCDIHSVRCPECYVETVIDEGVRPMCEVSFGKALAARHGDIAISTDALRAKGFDIRRCLRGERMYDADSGFFDLGGAAMLEAVILEAVLVRGMRRLIFFADDHAFERVVAPMLETARSWLGRPETITAGVNSVVCRCLKHGQRPGVSACKTKAANLRWFADNEASNEVRTLCLNKNRSAGEETHGMNLASTDAIFFLGPCHNSVQAVSRGLRAGVHRSDKDRYLLVYRA